MPAERGLTLRPTTYGARPLKRAIQQHVQDPLALALLEGKFGRGDAVAADVEGGRIVFAKEVVGEVV
jgi:ATP-dependent Clp protease ATP-binding subunit ClpB